VDSSSLERGLTKQKERGEAFFLDDTWPRMMGWASSLWTEEGIGIADITLVSARKTHADQVCAGAVGE
jgi:hypothetical protein